MRIYSQILILGIIFHLIALFAIFDVYYKSPIVNVSTPHRPDGIPPAKRLILFVADGLRAQSFYSLDPTTSPPTPAPYLRRIIEQEGSWGVSHTRVPTESRPGHVALIAGFYEDVSAVMKGWKENPVEFDSVFNRSTYTWSWGSPDILPMFAKGASGDRVFTYVYEGENEDFASDDASKLDTWVFDGVTEFLQNAKSDPELERRLNRDGVVFFLHLLGIDTNGHGYKPHSEEYMNNIRIVDRGIERMVKVFSDFYNNDGRTAHIFTADHGMTDWGSHGAGEDHETMTPLVAWGAGVPGPRKRSSNHHLSQDWGLETLERKDVEQADLTPLMSSLIGIEIPVNSVGKLPIQYLKSDEKYRFHAAYANFRQILAQFEVIRREKLSHSFRFLFREFPRLTATKLATIKREIARLAAGKRYSIATELCLEWIPVLIDGLVYYHQYERTFMGFAIASLFLSWIILLSVLTQHTSLSTISLVQKPNRPCIIICFLMSAVLFLQYLPWTNYIYCLTPLLILNTSMAVGQTVFQRVNVVLVLKAVALALFGSGILVTSFHYRSALSVGLCCLSVWPFTFRANQIPVSNSMRIAWFALCLTSAVFPLAPTAGQQSSIGQVIAGTLLMIGLHQFSVHKSSPESKSEETLARALLILGLLSIGIVYYTSYSIDDKKGLPFLCQMLSWTILVVSPLLPLLSEMRMRNRLRSFALSFLLLYTLLSTSYETLFYSVFTALLYVWLCLEGADLGIPASHWEDLQLDDISATTGKTSNKPLTLDDWRRAYFALFFVMLAFFGTGNIASINSFNPSFTRCFSTVFSPFLMGSLLVWKMIIPFLLVSLSLAALERITGRRAALLLLPILIFSDLMALGFYFSLKDTGSWLEIGTSISHYVISMSITVFVLILHQMTTMLITFQLKTLWAPKTHVF